MKNTFLRETSTISALTKSLTMRHLLRWLWGSTRRPLATVYTRHGCGLCDEAVALLDEEGFTVELVDIETDLALREKYDTLIPVVWIDGKERFRGGVNRVLLRRLRSNLRTENRE